MGKIVTAVIALFLQTPTVNAIVLANNQTASFVVVVDPSRTDPTRKAADELKKYLDKATGAIFEIRELAALDSTTPNVILVGAGAILSGLASKDPNLDVSKLKPDETLKKT